jgi:RHS repeat-associated protein
VVGKDGLALHYGATGELDEARRGARVWRYLHDEHGERILQLEDGCPARAFLGEAVVLGDRFLVPVRVAGHLVGVVDDGELVLLATDARGTVVADRDGTPSLASPYGERARATDLAEVLDYAEKGYDPDLGTVRMGARDYDPRRGRFLTPDPLVLEDPASCVDSPLECNLYGYARGNPLDFIDPEGRKAYAPVQRPLSKEMNALSILLPHLPPRAVHLPTAHIYQFSLFPGDRAAGNRACFEAAKKQTLDGNRAALGARRPTLLGSDRVIQIAHLEDPNGRVLADPTVARQALSYIDRALEAGYRVLVGVSYIAGHDQNTDGITDHFVTIHGRGLDEVKRVFYEFTDPGSHQYPTGRFYVDETSGKLFRPAVEPGPLRSVHNVDYEVTQVRTYEELRP